MRTHINPESAQRLLEVMESRGFTNTNHTLNVLISEAHTKMKTSKPYEIEVDNYDESSTEHQ